jgi:Txe/YoeB family toxin of Txe-Axe toxin-antitoxin module
MFTKKAWKQFYDISFKLHNKRVFEKLFKMIESISRNGYSADGQIKPLSANLSGWYRAEIDKKNRLVFRLNRKYDETILEIDNCIGHYDNN